MMAVTALVFALGLTVAAGYIYLHSLIMGLIITVIAAFVIYLSLPMYLVMREIPMGRRLPRLAMLFWLAVFGLLSLPKGTLVQLNNRGTGRIAVNSKQLHILVSRCVQWSGCKQNITRDVVNCRECGKCKIGEIKKLCFTHGVSVSVESGGTGARLRLKQKNPRLVMAMACERELLAGVLDTALPVVGITLRVGPDACSDSDVQISELEQRLSYALKED